MELRRWVGMSALLLMLSGCFLEERPAGYAKGDPWPPPAASPSVCPASGAEITVGEVEPALGHRSVAVQLTNCSSVAITVDGYPEVEVLDPTRTAMEVTVTRGSSFMAKDPGPARIRLAKGESVLAAVSWSNTVEAGAGKAAGDYLAVAKGKGNQAVVLPLVTDIGTTAEIILSAWSRPPRT